MNEGPSEDRHRIARLLDEMEQLRTALESAFDEIAQLADERDRLLRRVTTHAREIHAVNTAYSQTLVKPPHAEPDVAPPSPAEEELRVAFEEMQVLTEELEVANASLMETNRALDRRVEERTVELEGKNTALHRSELRFRTLVEGMPQLVWRSVDEGMWTWASPQWQAYTGQEEADSHAVGWLRVIHPDDRAVARAAWAAAMGGAPLEMETRIFHAGEQRYRHFRTRAQPVRDAGGAIVEWIGTCTDVDDLLTLQKQQTVMVAELQHRTRNLMGVVQSMLSRTMARSRSLDDFKERIADRMAALVRVQSLLSRRGEGQRVTLDTLLRAEIGAHVPLDERGRGEQVTISGPSDIGLRSATVQILALALHELTTNAIKYGALSARGGRLGISWDVRRDGDRRRLRIDWRERGVAGMPLPGAPAIGSGYGRELIERALPYQLGARTSFEFCHDGVHCSVEVDLTET